MDSVLTLGQNFRIAAYFENVTMAGPAGAAEIELSLPPGFVSMDPRIIAYDLQAQQYASWQVTAPATVANLSLISFRVVKPPEDENSNEPVIVTSDRANIPVSVQASVCLSVVPFLEGKSPTAVLGGKAVSLFRLAFENNSDNSIYIQSLTLALLDKSGAELPFTELFSLLEAVDLDRPEVRLTTPPQLPGHYRVTFSFLPHLDLPAYEEMVVDIRADILPGIPYASMQLLVESAQEDIVATDPEGNRAIISDGICAELATILYGSYDLVNSDFEDNFFNFPNPFAEMTNFSYYLAQDSQVNLNIYTLFGERVWSRTYRPEDPQGKAGLHNGFQQPTIAWEGRNGMERKVLNGVYIAIISANGETASTKIAIVK
jgi:hypothetical protein